MIFGDFDQAINFLESGGKLSDISEAEQNWFLKLADPFGFTVAHHLAIEGCKFSSPEILDLEDESGLSVGDILGFDQVA